LLGDLGKAHAGVLAEAPLGQAGALERLVETLHGMQVTLEYYMGQRPLAGAATQ
jgi:hypothetical protein